VASDRLGAGANDRWLYSGQETTEDRADLDGDLVRDAEERLRDPCPDPRIELVDVRADRQRGSSGRDERSRQIRGLLDRSLRQ